MGTMGGTVSGRATRRSVLRPTDCNVHHSENGVRLTLDGCSLRIVAIQYEHETIKQNIAKLAVPGSTIWVRRLA